MKDMYTRQLTDNRTKEELASLNHFLHVDYTSHSGKRGWRRVIPINIDCRVVTSVSPDPQWFLHVLMEDRAWARRSLLMRSIHEIKPGGPSPLSYGDELPETSS